MPLSGEGDTLARGVRFRIVVFGCALVAYSNSLTGPFHFDDFGVIVRYEAVHSFAALWPALRHGLRPVLKVTYAANWALGAGVVGFHLANLAVHLVNVELVMRLYAAARNPERRWPFAAIDRGACAAGVLFAIHPIQTEAVTYISGRSASLSTCFLLLSFSFYIASARGRCSLMWLVCSLLTFLCAVLTKETLAAFPWVLLLWELCIERTRWRPMFLRQGAFLLLAVGLVVAGIMHSSYFALLYQVAGTRPLLDAITYQIAGTGYVVSRLFLVHRLSIDPGLGLQPPEPVLLGLTSAGLLGLLVISLLEIRRRPLPAFGALFFLGNAFIPYAGLPRMDVMNERHMYLANVGVFMACGALWAELTGHPRLKATAFVAGTAVVVMLAACTIMRNSDYRSAIALWQSTARVSPANPRAHNNLGVAYESNGRLAEARSAYAAAVALEPRYHAARQNLARVERRMQRAVQAQP